MLNFLINFCLITFLCYAVAGPVKAILFPKKRRTRRAAAGTARAVSRTPLPAAGTHQLKNTVYQRQNKKASYPLKKAARKNLRAA